MARVRVLILHAAGTNCDLETEHAWRLAGAQPERVHLRRVIEQERLLDDYQILTLPGGFSYGDDIAAGRIFAAQLQRYVQDQLLVFLDAGKLALGICNGFQILVKTGLLPYPQRGGGPSRLCTVTFNDPPGFQDRWVRLRAEESPCVFLEPGQEYDLPIAHGEGRVVFAGREELARVESGRLNALRYVAGNGRSTGPESEVDRAGPARGDDARRFAGNPNGSDGEIAGLCDPSGRVFGLMPHPERFVVATQHPCWTSRPQREDGDGLGMFRRAVAYFA